MDGTRYKTNTSSRASMVNKLLNTNTKDWVSIHLSAIKHSIAGAMAVRCVGGDLLPASLA